MRGAFRKPKKKRALRIFFATDIHGSDVCFRKWLAAAKVYQADVLLVGGDFAGKGLVPVRRVNGSLRASVDGTEVTVPAGDFGKLAADINKRGFYATAMDDAELASIAGDPAAQDKLFRTEIAAQAKRWCTLAAERLDPDVRCIITPGNDDPVDADEVFAADERVEFPQSQVCDLGPVAMASLGLVPYTPWHTERECSEEELAKRIAELVDSVPAGRECLMNFHCPPYATGLDDAPELDATLKPVIRGGRPSIVPVGSHAVRDAIKKYQPPVSLHGHIHESRGVQRLGRTLCLNPGSDYSSGVLRGAVVDIAEDGSCLDFLLTTG
jgi:Icc-related predicted phosphoesterase